MENICKAVSKAGFKVSIQKKRAAPGNTLKVIFTNNMLHYRGKRASNAIMLQEEDKSEGFSFG